MRNFFILPQLKLFMKQKKGSIILAILCCLMPSVMFGQAQSYIYLEGIKGIPYKVKLNGIEQTSLGRNYIVMKANNEGENVIDILFSGDMYPTQTFVLDIRSASSYGYKLAKAGEQKFYLLDVVNAGKIIETNSNINVGLSTPENAINFYVPESATHIDNNQAKHFAEVQIGEMSNQINEHEKGLTTKKKKKKSKPIEPVTVLPLVKPIEVKTPTEAPKHLTTSNTDHCVKLASDLEMNAFLDKLKLKPDDEGKLLVVKKKIFTGCITTEQLGKIAETFDSQYGRFAAIKFLYPEVADPESVANLENLFRYDSYKSKLKKM
jgi:Domain of unknown function (DUF4476)